VAIRQAGDAADQIGRLAGSTSDVLDRDGRPLVTDLRRTLRTADQSLAELQGAVRDARPGIQAFSNQTLPEVGQLMLDLRATSESLRDITDRLNQRGIGGVVGGQRLPDYHPGRGN
jgi:phospholipid/cholesterol/gamma-HCH transport system substrate-binding protein